MVQILNEIPQEKAGMVRLPKTRPEIEMFGSPVSIIQGGVQIPPNLMNDYFRAFNVNPQEVTADNIEDIKDRIEAVHSRPSKEAYIRFADDRPIKIVSAKFEDVNLRQLASDITDRTGHKPKIRYSDLDGRILLNFPVDKVLPGLHIMVDGGTYAKHGGSGETAVHYGISWDNREVGQWTLFLGKTLGDEYSRAIHLKGDALPQRLESLVGKAEIVAQSIDSSKRVKVGEEDVIRYLSLYAKKGFSKSVVAKLISELPLIDGYDIKTGKAPAYGLAARVIATAYEPIRRERTKLRGEAIAGEIIYSARDLK